MRVPCLAHMSRSFPDPMQAPLNTLLHAQRYQNLSPRVTSAHKAFFPLQINMQCLQFAVHPVTAR